MTMLVCTLAAVELDVVSPKQLLREQARVRVILGQPIDVVTERVRACSGQDPGLAHRAAGHAAVPMRAPDQVA